MKFNDQQNEALREFVLEAEEGHVFIEMGHRGPKITVVPGGGDWGWCSDKPDLSVPIIEELIPQLETAGPRARKCAEDGKKILARWEGLKLGKRKPIEAELKWMLDHRKIKTEPEVSVSVKSKNREIVNRAAEIAEKIIGEPQVVERGRR
jgi:hypothetical protein